ncbi:hypothetical protein AX774_g663 [Zancudomyces culisetae]|uniref:Uncharacterized protein n=1 Tax=Zancudomyces culisetae TaxID=1213189 RepID=A0A1R1PXX2_ZANCU|nr:hypothetical protein AX774_g663 [Zancudomyces culisetae]|eukprot:OMH85789.1 hypothetical protein AX774_g663 [Zancudomyces culisetae]
MHSTGGIVVNKDSGEGETKNFDAIIPYLVAVDNGGGVKELRKKYFIKSMQRLEKHRVRDEEIGEILGATATVKDAAHEIKNENEEKIAHINEQSRIQMLMNGKRGDSRSRQMKEPEKRYSEKLMEAVASVVEDFMGATNEISRECW